MKGWAGWLTHNKHSIHFSGRIIYWNANFCLFSFASLLLSGHFNHVLWFLGQQRKQRQLPLVSCQTQGTQTLYNLQFLLLLPHAGICTVYAETRAGLHLSFISKIEVLPLAPFKIYFLSPTTCKHDILILRVLCQWYSSEQDLLTHITDYWNDLSLTVLSSSWFLCLYFHFVVLCICISHLKSLLG